MHVRGRRYGVVDDPFANDPFASSSSADPFGGDPFENAFKQSATESPTFAIDLPQKVSGTPVSLVLFQCCRL